MTITDKANKYSKEFKTGKRDNGKEFVYLEENASKELKDSVHRAHGDKLPDDWIYGTYADLMQRVSEYELENEEQLQDVRHEIVDSAVDIYTHELTAWLAEDINNVGYLTQALEEYGHVDGFKALAMAQYLAIDEVMNYVYDLLVEGN